MVDSPFAEEALSATQPATTPAALSAGGPSRGDAAVCARTALATTREDNAISPSPDLSPALQTSVDIAISSRDTEGGAGTDIYPSLLPLPSHAVTSMRRSSAHSRSSASPFRLTSKSLPDEAESRRNGVLKESALPGASENIDPVQHQMEQQQQQEANASLKKGRSSFAASSVDRLASSGCSSPLLEDMMSPGSREEAPVTSSSGAEQREEATSVHGQCIDATWQRHVRSWCSTTSSLESSISDMRLREETRRNTRRNASPLSARNLRAQLQQRQRRQQVLRKSSSPLRPQRTAAISSDSAPVTPLRFHIASWQQQPKDHADGQTPPRSEHIGAVSASCIQSAVSAAAAADVAVATPVSDRLAAGRSPMRSILRSASASGSANSLSVRRVVFTPVPRAQIVADNEGRDQYPWLSGRAAADEEAAPVSSGTGLEHSERGVAARVADCSEAPSEMSSNSISVLEKQQREEHQHQSMLATPTEPPRRSCEDRRRGSASESSQQLQQQNEQPQCIEGCDEAQQQQQQHRSSAQGSTEAAEGQHAAEGSQTAEGKAAADAAATTAMHTGTQATRAPTVTEASTLVESISGLALASTTEATSDADFVSENTEIAVALHKSGPAVAAADVVTAATETAEVDSKDGSAAEEKEGTASQGLKVPTAAAAPASEEEATRKALHEEGPPAADRSDGYTDPVRARSGGLSYCNSPTRVLVVNSEGETELLLQSAPCLVAPALSEPLRADPTPVRKPPARPPSGAQARAAAARARASCVNAPPVCASAGFAAAADGDTMDATAATIAEEKVPKHVGDDEVNSHEGNPATAICLPLQQQQHHEQVPPCTSDQQARIPPESALGRRGNFAYTAEVETYSPAEVDTTAGLAAVQTVADGGYSSPHSKGASCDQLLEQAQHQQQQSVNDEAELASRGASETSSTPVTPFAGPDPLSGDAPLSPRLAVPSGRGGSRIVSTSAMSFLLSVRHQLEAEAAVQQEQQPGQQQRQRKDQAEQEEEDSPSHDLREPILGMEGSEAKQEGSQAEQQQQQQLEQQEQQQLDAGEPQRQLDEATVSSSSIHEQQRGVEGVRTPSILPIIAEVQGDETLVDAAAPGVQAAASSSGSNSGGPSEVPHSQATPSQQSCKNSDSRSADLESTSSRSSNSVLLSDGRAANTEAGNSNNGNIPWRTQWKALDALTNRLLQGLPRALTVIAGEESGSPVAARESEPTVQVGPSAPETGGTEATEPSRGADPAIPRISWIDYREERLRELQLCEGERHEIETQREDIDNGPMQEEGDELSEVQQLLKHRLMQCGLGVASTAAEQLLMQPAKTRRNWNELCKRTEELLQQQLRNHIEPLSQQMTRDLKQVEEALEAAAIRVEGAAEAKRLRLSRESWESGFVALAEERHVALQSATSNVDTAAASLGRLLEQETQMAEEIAAMKAEIRGFDNTSDDLRLLADIRHKESIVKAFERLSGVRIQRVSTTGLVAELAWPRSLPAAVALQIPVDNCATDVMSSQATTNKLFHRLYGAADYPAASTRITISWSREETQQTHLQRHAQPAPVPSLKITSAACAAVAPEPATPIRQRVQIMRPCPPPGGISTDSAICTPLLASRRGKPYGADIPTSAGAMGTNAADAPLARTVGAVSQWNQPQHASAAAGEPRFLPITSCKLQSRFPVLRAVAASANSGTIGGMLNSDALPPHRRWMFSVEQLRYFLLGAVQRSLQQMLLQQGPRSGANDGPAGAPTPQETFCATSTAGVAPGSHLANFGMRGLSGSGDLSSQSSTETDSRSSGAEATEGRHPAIGAPPFPDLSTVRALLLHAHAAAGRVALLHDQLLLLLHAFTNVTSVGFDDRGEDSSLPHLVFKTFLAPSTDELPVLQFSLTIDLGEALTRGSLLLAVEAVEIKCLSALDDICTDGQEACKDLHSAFQSRLEALWDSDKETLSSEGCTKAFSDQGLVECLYSACDECGYSRGVEDWRLERSGTPYPEDDFASFASWGSAEASALERWTTLLEDAGLVPLLP